MLRRPALPLPMAQFSQHAHPACCPRPDRTTDRGRRCGHRPRALRPRWGVALVPVVWPPQSMSHGQPVATGHPSEFQGDVPVQRRIMGAENNRGCALTQAFQNPQMPPGFNGFDRVNVLVSGMAHGLLQLIQHRESIQGCTFIARAVGPPRAQSIATPSATISARCFSCSCAVIASPLPMPSGRATPASVLRRDWRPQAQARFPDRSGRTPA